MLIYFTIFPDLPLPSSALLKQVFLVPAFVAVGAEVVAAHWFIAGSNPILDLLDLVTRDTCVVITCKLESISKEFLSPLYSKQGCSASKGGLMWMPDPFVYLAAQLAIIADIIQTQSSVYVTMLPHCWL
ncbi:MAG TPA: hypothetical protein PKV43_10185 [Armatimonadota bacterium]|nr:hypothetical protein [Armatimonadota bacterium]